MPKLLTGKMLRPQLQVFLLVLRRKGSKELPRVKKTLQAESRQLVVWEPLTRIRHLPVSLWESQFLSSAWNTYCHGTELGETNILFWVSFRKHYGACLLLVVNHILIWESCFMEPAANRTQGPWVPLVRAVVTEPQWALLDMEKGCSHTGVCVCCSWMLCCTLTLFVHWKVGQGAQDSGGNTIPGNFKKNM